MKKQKKGAITLYFLIIALIITVTILIFYTAPSKEELEFVGATQQKLLISKEIKNQAILFLDASSKLAVKETIKDLNENSGFTIIQHSTEHPCKRAIYPIINENKEINCFPEYNKSAITYFQFNFDKMIDQSREVALPSNQINIELTQTQNTIRFNMITSEAIPIPLFQSFSNYYDEKIKNVIGAGIPRYSYDRSDLVPIKNIPNIICDETDTRFGKICAGNPDMIRALETMSSDYLVPKNRVMIITQAYRTYEIQKALYLHACAQQDCSLACNPDTRNNCPHMIAGAIDLNIIDQNTGRNLNNQAALQEDKDYVVEVMCKYGFVNWVREPWHFEYGTAQWEIARERRARGERACQYPFI